MKKNLAGLPAPRLRATLTEVARLARVSLMTASYAMRNNPRISVATRARVQRCAKKINYAPDPEITRLMHLLRANRRPSHQATLGFLSFSHLQTANTHQYTINVIAGAKSRAAQLGYSVDFLDIDYGKFSPARLTTILKSRGIRGVLVPPQPAIVNCAKLLDWSQFSVVAATYSAQHLIVNRVVPHHHHNIMLAISNLHEAGYRRLGLILNRDLVLRANFAYQSVFAYYQQIGTIAAIPFLEVSSKDQAGSAVAIRAWLKKFEPDMLLTVEDALPALHSLLGRKFGTTVGVGLLDHMGNELLPGIRQNSVLVGETAIDVLAGQVQRGELGLTKYPRITMVEGDWRWGKARRKIAGRVTH